MKTGVKIAILGCRGIPNHYGGFGQLAEYLSVGLVEKGCDVTVYNSHNHPYQKSTWNGVHIVHVNDPEHKIGTFGQFIYDYNAILDSRKRDFDVILQLGYTSSSIWFPLLPKKAKISSNMDGLEWKRRKFSWPVQQFLKLAEYMAVVSSDALISDSLGIQKHILNRFNKNSDFIAYGAHLFKSPNVDAIKAYNVSEYAYDILVARMEPENNIEEILLAKSNAKDDTPLLVVGNTQRNEFGKKMKSQFSSNPKIRFCEGIYDIEVLNNLRYYSRLYIHGHSVGGTNPSLLEAMASKALLVVHDNDFNNSVVETDAFKFNSVEQLQNHFDADYKKIDYENWTMANFKKIETFYSWELITDKYYDHLMSLLK